MKVVVVGASGGVGQSLSLLLKSSLPAQSELALYDINENIHGVALDLSHIPSDVSVAGYAGHDLPKALTGADIVIIIAGIARKPGMTRADLLSINANIVGGIIKAIATHCPKALVGIVTNPVNSLIPAAAAILRQLGAYDEKKLFGVTALDQLRTNTFVAQELGLAPSTLKIPVIGGHSGQTILPLLSQAPGAYLSPEAIEQLNDRIKNAGTAVVEAKAGAGSATLSMAQAAATFTQALVKALAGESQEVCAYVANPDMDIEFFARPVLVGPNGIESFVDYGPLSPQEEEEVQNLKAVLRTDIAEGYDAVAHEG